VSSLLAIGKSTNRAIIILLVLVLVFNATPIRTDNSNTIIIPDQTSTNDWTDVKNFIIKYNSTHVWFRIEYHKGIADEKCRRYVRIYLDTDLDGRGDFWIDPVLWIHSDQGYYPVSGNTYSIYEESIYEMGIKLESIGSSLAIGLPYKEFCSEVYDDLKTLTYTINKEKNIKIDGMIDDWEGEKPILNDPRGDT
jgi:hypothetical protein